jgi:hypothetical protein
MIYLKKFPPYFGKKGLPPIFFMEHFLQGLYGVNAPACEYHISTSIGYTWAIQIPESGDGGFSVCRSTVHCAFSDLLVLFKLALTVPIASASAERSLSAMCRIKSHLRASSIALRSKHGDRPINRQYRNSCSCTSLLGTSQVNFSKGQDDTCINACNQN